MKKPKQNLRQKLESRERFFIASFWDRAKAQVIDTFMIYLPILYVLTYGIIGSAQGFRDSVWAPFLAVLLYGVIVAFLIAWKSQSIGKKAYNLKVFRDNGEKLGFFYALLRFFVFLVCGAFLVGILSPLWRKDKKAWHDLLLKTRVVKVVENT